MRTVLARFQGQVIGMNLTSPKRMELTRILEVGDDYVTVRIKDGGLHVPFRWIMEISEAEPGRSFKVARETVPILVYMYHLVVYSGGAHIGVGMIFDS